MKLPPMKLGVVGQPSSGKDTVSDYLQDKYGFTHFSGGDLFRKYIRDHNLGEPTRPLTQKVANELKKKHGANYVMQNALKIKTDYLVVSGTRNVADVETFKEAGGKLIVVEAPLEKRYRRAVERKRPGDNLTLAQFRAQEESEHKNELHYAQNVLPVIALADYTLENNGTLEDLHAQIDQLLEKISKEIS